MTTLHNAEMGCLRRRRAVQLSGAWRLVGAGARLAPGSLRVQLRAQARTVGHSGAEGKTTLT